MQWIELIALAVVTLTGSYMLGLGAASLVTPDRANRFLLGFAGSRSAHYAELIVRLAVGAALVLHAPRMFLPGAFSFFGWLLLATTACLLLVPWRWHHRFAQQAVPRALRYIRLIGLASLALGVFTLAAVVHGGAA